MEEQHYLEENGTANLKTWQINAVSPANDY